MPAVLYEKKDGIAYITYNRPEAMNAINAEVSVLMNEAWQDFKNDRSLKVAIVTGAGNRAFTAGADLKDMAQGTPEGFAEQYWHSRPPSPLADLWKPVIAAVNGYCIAAGMNMLMKCDIRVASENASFRFAEVVWGFMDALGELPMVLPRQIPYAAAMYMLLTGDWVDAQTALRWGLVNEVVPFDRLLPRAEEISRKICELPPLAVRGLKENVIRGLSMPIADGMRFGQTMCNLIRYTEDAREGPRAFAEKRPPVYKGR